MVLYYLLSIPRSPKGLEKVYIEGGSHGIDSRQKAEQGRLWDKRLPGRQTQGAAKQHSCFQSLLCFVCADESDKCPEFIFICYVVSQGF